METGAREDGNLDRSIAHTASIYDALPYESKPILRTHPARLAGVARLYGLDPAPLASARVLELGCAAGGNLIPLAARNPDGRFFGVDLGKHMIEDGQARIASLGLRNIELRHQSITELGEDVGQFDYVICHGVYSWVPEPVREKILEICGNRLSPVGVAYVSYNVLPGWRMFQPLRDAIRAMIPESPDATTRARQGAAFVRFLGELALDSCPYAGLLRKMPARLMDFSLDYLFHEYMEPVNEPCTFSDFVRAAERHGLSYLGESDMAVMFPEVHGAEFAARLDAVTNGIVAQQQLLDIMTGTAFRTTLLVPHSLGDRIDRSAAAARLETLFFAASERVHKERAGEAVKLKPHDGEEQVIEDPMIVRLVDRLFAPVRSSFSFDACSEGFAGPELERVRSAIVEMIASGYVNVLSEPLGGVAVGERPCVDAVVRDDVRADRSFTASLMHHPVGLDDACRLLIPHLDGTASHADLERVFISAVDDGTITLEPAEGNPDSTEELPEIARRVVAASLESIAAFGLLQG